MQKRLVALIIFLAVCCRLGAQTPCGWSFTAKKTAEKTYEIHCVVTVESPWHVYSQFTPEGGPRPTKFSFVKNPLCVTEGTVKENGKMNTRHEEVFGVDVKYFNGQVDFVQLVKIKGGAKTIFSGSVEYM